MPDDIAAAVDFNYTIVELVGDEVVVGLVELTVVGSTVLIPCEHRHCRPQQHYSKKRTNAGQRKE
jgi:hypothetical protein